MQKVLKKIVSILFTLVLISSIGIVSSFAYQVPQNSETAVLKGNEHYSCSGKVIGTFKLFGAKTKRESNRAMKPVLCILMPPQSRLNMIRK